MSTVLVLVAVLALVAIATALVVVAVLFIRAVGPGEVGSACVALVGLGAGAATSSAGVGGIAPALFAGVGLVGVGVLGWILTRLRSERRLWAARFPGQGPAGRTGQVVLGGVFTEVAVRHEMKRGSPRRFLDGRTVVLSVGLAPKGVRLERRSFFDGLRAAPPSDIHTRTWLGPGVLEVIEALDHARVYEGRVEIRRGAWTDPVQLDAWFADLAEVVAALRRSAFEAPARFEAAALGDLDPGRRRQGWSDLEAVSSERARQVAPRLLADPDPVLRVGAGLVAGEAGARVLERVLRSADDGLAVARAARWAKDAERVDLAGVIAARLGIPPVEAWPDLVEALAALGGRPEMTVLHEVAGAEGYPAVVRARAVAAMTRIRERLGPESAGRIAVVAAVGGELSLPEQPGAVTLVGGGKSGG